MPANFRVALRVILPAACLILAQLAATTATQAAADQPNPPRHALVIGNSRYPVGALVNPVNEARAVAERLREAGFSVTLKLDTGRRDLREAIRDFSEILGRNKGIGVFYFAGHGVQLNWRNFLVPVDARIRRKADVQAEAVDLGLLLDGLGRARNAMNIVILDACRNNPFGPDFRVDDKGLSQLDAPTGTLLAYATAPGNVAIDGEGRNGLYTRHLLRDMRLPGLRIEDVFKRVRSSVAIGFVTRNIHWRKPPAPPFSTESGSSSSLAWSAKCSRAFAHFVVART